MSTFLRSTPDRMDLSNDIICGEGEVSFCASPNVELVIKKDRIIQMFKFLLALV